MSTIDVAFGVDRANLDQVAVVIRSVLKNTGEPEAFRFHILTAEDAVATRGRVAQWGLGNIAVVPVQHQGRTVEMSVPVASLLRLQLPTALASVQRVVYLDADVLVKADIRDLHAVDLQGRPVGAVVDMPLYIRLRRERIRGRREFRDYLCSLGLDPEPPSYFNAGVVVMDLDALRRLRFVEAAAAIWSERAETLRYHDQCVLNIALRGNVAYLDPRWNVMAQTMTARHLHYVPKTLAAQVGQQLAEQWIIHYAGPRKPWNHAETWRGDEWWTAAEGTGLALPRPAAARATTLDAARKAYFTLTWWLSMLRAAPQAAMPAHAAVARTIPDRADLVACPMAGPGLCSDSQRRTSEAKMADFETARRRMVDNQLRTANITDRRLLAAMGEIPRERFVPENRQALAYADAVHHLGAGRALASPAPFAKLVQLADVESGDSVLDVGAATGYTSAVLARLAAHVTALESDSGLADRARVKLADVGVTNVRVDHGALDGAGLHEQFDVILIEGAVSEVPAKLFALLKDGGRLVALVQTGGAPSARVFVRAGDEITHRTEFNTTLPPLASVASSDSFVF